MRIGRFYFKETTSGNLLGEYSHRGSDSRAVYAEAATRTTYGRGWVGEYKTAWREEPDSAPAFALLRISPAEDSELIFRIEWFDEKYPERPLFEGEGMECDGILIGDYTQSQNENGT